MFPALLALGLAATVALPAATALQIATTGNAAADAAWKQTASLGGDAYCAAEGCRPPVRAGGALNNEGSASAKAGWSLAAETNEKAAIDAAAKTAEELRAEAEARARATYRQAMETKERVRVDARAEHDVHADGDVDAAMESSGRADGNVGLDGLLTVGTGKSVDLREEKRMKAEAEARARAEAEATTDTAVGLLARLLQELQGKLTMAADAAANVAAGIQGSVSGALGLGNSVHVSQSLSHSASVGASLGAVPDVEVPRIEPPSLGLSGDASLVAKAQGAARGVVRG